MDFSKANEIGEIADGFEVAAVGSSYSDDQGDKYLTSRATFVGGKEIRYVKPQVGDRSLQAMGINLVNGLQNNNGGSN